MALNEKLVSAIAWTASIELISKLIGFVSSIMLARILVPSDFGLLATINVFTSMALILMQAGLTTSLLRDEYTSKEDYNTIFISNLGVGFILYLILFISAPFLADWYQDPRVNEISKITSLALVIQALYAVHHTKLMKELKFKEVSLYQLFALIVGVIGGLITSFNGLSYWSLVIQLLITEIVKAFFYIVNSGLKIKIQFYKQSFRRHFQYGSNMAASSILNAFFAESYAFIIGKMYTFDNLGYYNRAQSLSQLPATAVSSIVHKVSFPYLAKIQNDDQKLKEVQRMTMQAIVLAIGPLMGICAVIAQPLFTFLFTSKWDAAAPMFQLLTIIGLLYPLHAFNLQVVAVKGRSDLFFRAEIWKKVIIAGFILLALWLGGLYALIISSIFASFCCLFINMYFCNKVLTYSICNQLKDILPVLAFCGLVTLFVYILHNMLFKTTLHPMMNVSITLLLGFGLYALILRHYWIRDWRVLLTN